jgi:hypothetical protein
MTACANQRSSRSTIVGLVASKLAMPVRFPSPALPSPALRASEGHCHLTVL